MPPTPITSIWSAGLFKVLKAVHLSSDIRQGLIYNGVSSNAFGSNEFVFNEPLEALPYLQSNDPIFISNQLFRALGIKFQTSR